MTVAYDGKSYKGFVIQNGLPTVEGELGSAFLKMFGFVPAITCAGRTDAGVHAIGQVIHFDINDQAVKRLIGNQVGDSDDTYVANRICRSADGLTSDSVRVVKTEIVNDSFDARHSAKLRHYRYTAIEADALAPHLSNVAWIVENKLDIELMNQCSKMIIGEVDFTTFCKKPKGQADVSLARCVQSALWSYCDRGHWREVVFEVTANAFCHHMIRSLVSFMINVGAGKKNVDDFRRALEAKDRAMSSGLAPSGGLCFVGVTY